MANGEKTGSLVPRPFERPGYEARRQATNNRVRRPKYKVVVVSLLP